MTRRGETYPGLLLGGRYQLLVPLADGATASVWAARTVGSALEKLVAVKVAHADIAADIDAEAMFVNEAELIARIRHPNVVDVLDLGEDGDTLYIVMEWIEGEPLQVVMREAGGQRMTVSRALRIVGQAAAGLHAAHELRDREGRLLGLVHRDVSPQNILVGYDGVVKVIDFGIAKASSMGGFTDVGQVKGSTSYMSPEQATGRDVDRRTDVFALGVVLYQLLTGKHPFRRDSEYATLARLGDRDPAAPPRRIVPELSPGIEDVVLRALAKDRSERFADMIELTAALRRAAPAAPGDEEDLGAFLGRLLAHRAAARAQVLREAREGLRAGDLPRFRRGPLYSLGDRASIPDVPTPLPLIAGRRSTLS